jgi:RNA polymerase sigma factor (sigma-70 family)
MDDHEDAGFGIGAAEEHSLLRRIASGDRRAEQKLLEAYEPLIAAAVRRCTEPGDTNWGDLFQQGRVGLLQAARRFDATRDVRFGTYARSWVDGAIRDAFGPADRELAGLAAEELEGLPGDDVGDHGDVGLGSAGRSRRQHRRLDELVGGRESGRDAYLMHHAAADAEARSAFVDWLTETRGWTLDDRAWEYLRVGEPELVARARGGEVEALARLEQKYSALRDKFGLEERSHVAKELRIGPDRRSEALAKVVALAVAKGTLPDLRWRTERGMAAAPGFAEVGAFRERYLGGELIAEDRVVAWVEKQLRIEGSPAPGYVRVPRAEVDLQSFGEPAIAESAADYAAWLEGTARRVREGGEVELPEARTLPPLALSYGVPGKRPRIERIRGDGALARLKAVVSELLAHFDGWLEEEAVAFVLAGSVPPLDKLRAKTRRGLYGAASRITLDCDPRTAPAEVAAFYEQLRKRWVKGRDRVMEDRGLALAIFTEEHWRPSSTWSDLQALWNNGHPVGDPLHSEVPLNQFQTECRVSWERLTAELWPGGKRAKRKLAGDVAAARARRQSRLPRLPD